MAKKSVKFSCPCGRGHVIKLVDGKLEHEITGEPSEEVRKKTKSDGEGNGKSATILDFFKGTGAFASDDEADPDEEDPDEDEEED